MLALTLISAMSSGQTRLAIVTAPIAAFFVWLFSVLLLAPRVSYNRDRVVIVNFARVHCLPWPTISHVAQGIDLVFTLNDGRKIHAFGSPYPKRGNALMKTKTVASGRNHDGEVWILEDFRRNARDTGAVAAHPWQKTTLLIGLALFLACVGTLVIEGLVW